ncbi:MAG: right-handed parallel beta-helix repeat-containing protein, partial [Candidatus Cloacimonetes bacterium]|nr:right-handed parallel beta-helix repeat-containing protein [Candidatus Cloacimonadota bacterium]
MKTYVIWVLLLVFPILIFAENVSGNVSGEWTIENSPYYVTGDLTITLADTLLIHAGVQVVFQGNYLFIVNGRLNANGNENEPISFKAEGLNGTWRGFLYVDSNNEMLVQNSTFRYCSFEDGYAYKEDGEPDYYEYGAALRAVNSSKIRFQNCTFKHNTANWSGGAIYLENSDLIFSDCLFLENTSSFAGSGIMCESSDIILERCTFKNNQAVAFGALSLWEESSAHVVNSSFLSNRANACGGIYVTSSDLELIGCILARNESTYGSGGAIGASLENNVKLTNCTLFGNTSPMMGGGIWANAQTLVMIKNTIFWNNSESLSLNDGSLANASYSLIPEGFEGENILTCDPAFPDTSSSDFNLQQVSPCVDAGTPDVAELNLPLLDIHGNNRIQDGDQDGTALVDIGASEYNVIVSQDD